jgi:DNA invertase Pin-like site-specific DNA recombinase
MIQHNTNYVVYYRVSTQRQGRSGLGLEAQAATVRNFLRGQKPLAEFTDIQSGKRADNRVNLMLALDMVNKTGATLLVAKLDRLARSVSFISTLQDSKVKFLVAESPELNEMTIQILAVVAQNELRLISGRIKGALKAAKARGTILGKSASTNFTDTSRALGSKAVKAKAQVNPENVRARALAKALKNGGKSIEAIATALNNANFKTSRGNIFHPTSVQRLLKQAA